MVDFSSTLLLRSLSMTYEIAIHALTKVTSYFSSSGDMLFLHTNIASDMIPHLPRTYV